MSSAIAGQPVDTRATLAGALLSQVPADASGLGDAAGVCAEHDHDADAGSRPDGPQREGGIRRREVGRPDPRAAVAADEERLRGSGRRGPRRDLRQRGAPVDLDHPGVLHRSRDRDERGTGVLDHPVGAERPPGRYGRSWPRGPGSRRCVPGRRGGRGAAGRPCRAGTPAGTHPTGCSRTSADSSPATKRSGGRTRVSGTGEYPAAARSATAALTAAATWSRPAGMQTVPAPPRRRPRAAGRRRERGAGCAAEAACPCRWPARPPCR